MYDFTIIGAGVVGCMIARELSRYNVSVCLLEKEHDVSCGASKANSGIIHGGYDAKHGTLKSKLSRKGNRMFKKLNEELNFGYSEIGSLVLAFTDEEVLSLNDLYENGIKNNVHDLDIINKKQILEMEPNINQDVLAALYCPSAGIVSPYELTIALCENAITNGVDLMLQNEVLSIDKLDKGFLVNTTNSHIRTRFIINCAGAYSDKISNMLGLNDFYITPRRGEYILLNKNQGSLAKHVLFQTPSSNGKGILVTPTYHGNLMLGPNAQETQDRSEVSTNKEILNYIVETARKSIPSFDIKMTLTSFAGIRATSNRHDFIIQHSKVNGFIEVAGIESPGLTSSPAIADMVLDIIKKEIDISLTNKDSFNPYRRAIIIKKDENFLGSIDNEDPSKNIICRCENVTEAEIIDAINRGIEINSTDAIKRRTRAGMGPCQGNFCGSRVVSIISKETGLDKDDISTRGKGSSILPKRENRLFYKEKA